MAVFGHVPTSFDTRTRTISFCNKLGEQNGPIILACRLIIATTQNIYTIYKHCGERAGPHAIDNNHIDCTTEKTKNVILKFFLYAVLVQCLKWIKKNRIQGQAGVTRRSTFQNHAGCLDYVNILAAKHTCIALYALCHINKF